MSVKVRWPALRSIHFSIYKSMPSPFTVFFIYCASCGRFCVVLLFSRNSLKPPLFYYYYLIYFSFIILNHPFSLFFFPLSHYYCVDLCCCFCLLFFTRFTYAVAHLTYRCAPTEYIHIHCARIHCI